MYKRQDVSPCFTYGKSKVGNVRYVVNRLTRIRLSLIHICKELEAYTREITSELISCDKLFGSRDSGCACPTCGTGRMRFSGTVVRRCV